MNLIGDITNINIFTIDYRISFSNLYISFDAENVYLESEVRVIASFEILGIFDIDFHQVEIKTTTSHWW